MVVHRIKKSKEWNHCIIIITRLEHRIKRSWKDRWSRLSRPLIDSNKISHNIIIRSLMKWVIEFKNYWLAISLKIYVILVNIMAVKGKVFKDMLRAIRYVNHIYKSRTQY